MMQSVGNTRVYYLQHHANNFFQDRQVCQLKGKEKTTTAKANMFQGKTLRTLQNSHLTVKAVWRLDYS